MQSWFALLLEAFKGSVETNAHHRSERVHSKDCRFVWNQRLLGESLEICSAFVGRSHFSSDPCLLMLYVDERYTRAGAFDLLDFMGVLCRIQRGRPLTTRVVGRTVSSLDGCIERWNTRRCSTWLFMVGVFVYLGFGLGGAGWVSPSIFVRTTLLNWSQMTYARTGEGYSWHEPPSTMNESPWRTHETRQRPNQWRFLVTACETPMSEACPNVDHRQRVRSSFSCMRKALSARPWKLNRGSVVSFVSDHHLRFLSVVFFFPSRSLQFLVQVPSFVHVDEDVCATHELTIDEHLRYGGPFGVLLDPFAQVRIFEHVPGAEFRAVGTQHLYDDVAEPAHGRIRRAFHVHHDPMVLDVLLYGFRHVLVRVFVLGLEIFVGVVTPLCGHSASHPFQFHPPRPLDGSSRTSLQCVSEHGVGLDALAWMQLRNTHLTMERRRMGPMEREDRTSIRFPMG